MSRIITRGFGYLFFWTAVGLFFAVQSVLTYASNGQPARWGAPLVWQLGYWYTWALFAPFVYRVAKRFPMDESSWTKSVPALLGVTTVVAPAQVAIATLVRAWGLRVAGIIDAEQMVARIDALPSRLLPGSLDAAFTLWMMLAAIYAFLSYRRVRESEVAASRLQAELAKARLSNLRAQIQPHFLFNTLNSISALVTDDPIAAERMIARLSTLLRMALESGDVQFVSVREELRFSELYLEIESVRFEDRLVVSLEADPDVLDARIPTLILQPVVENAVKHGIAPFEESGRVSVRVYADGNRLRLDVCDTGAGRRASSAVNGDGIGLSNTKSRLEAIYDEDWSLTTENRDDEFCVCLCLPLE